MEPKQFKLRSRAILTDSVSAAIDLLSSIVVTVYISIAATLRLIIVAKEVLIHLAFNI